MQIPSLTAGRPTSTWRTWEPSRAAHIPVSVFFGLPNFACFSSICHTSQSCNKNFIKSSVLRDFSGICSSNVIFSCVLVTTTMKWFISINLSINLLIQHFPFRSQSKFVHFYSSLFCRICFILVQLFLVLVLVFYLYRTFFKCKTKKKKKRSPSIV